MLQTTGRTQFVCGLAFAAVLSATPTIVQPAHAQSPESATVALLSPSALDALVSSVAFYPDEVVEQVLQAAQQPALLHDVATGAARASSDPSVQYLTQYPDLLRQLDQQLSLTARLGVAAKTQVQDVWAAVDRVRAGYQASLRSQTPQSVGAAPVTGVYVPLAYTRYAAGLWAGAAVHELHHEYDAYHNTQTTTGVNGGTATSTSVGGQVTQGNTTYSGVAGAAAVTGPNGNTAYGVGAAGGAVTSTGSGYQTESAAAGAVVNPATGNYAAGAYSGSGYTQQNADGSTSFGRESTVNTQSSYGSTSIDRESTGTAAGVGNSSYSGSTSIDSTYGNANVETQAGNSQISTTVSTDNGSQTFTGGDGSVGSSSPNTRSSQAASSQFGRSSASSRGGQSSRPSSRSSLAKPSSPRSSSYQRSQSKFSSGRSSRSTGTSSRSGRSRSSGGRSSGGRSGGGRSGGGRSGGGGRGR